MASGSREREMKASSARIVEGEMGGGRWVRSKSRWCLDGSEKRGDLKIRTRPAKEEAGTEDRA